MKVNIHGELFDMGGITGVATYPEYTKMGLMHALIRRGLEEMRENRQTISFLYPYSIPFYRKMGWEIISDKMSYTIKDTQLPKFVDVPGMVERVADNHPDFLALHDRFTLQRHGMLLRDDLAWEEYWRWDTDDIVVALYYDEDHAAQGYVVVAPNRRGLPSFGQEWLDQISGDYAGQNIRDYLSAIDDVAGEPWADETRMGCVGASYGGYSVFFLAGCHEKRFKAFIAHCGIFNFESMYGETEELFFINNDYGGPYWDRSNQVAQRSYANSPHKFVSKWDTPILIFTGEYDFRIPYTQSLEAFTAARVRGIPARLVEFENEAHQVFRPQNSLVWNREFFGWLDKYVK